jgi:DNA-binding transcriptional regulator LsrR (DeoR family)
MARKKRWHPSAEKDKIVFAVLDRFLAQLDEHYNPRLSNVEGDRKAGAAAIAEWVQEEFGRDDVTRERIYPLFWEAARRGYLSLRPPRDIDLAAKIRDGYGVGTGPDDRRSIEVLDVRGGEAAGHVPTAAADRVLELIREIGQQREPVHVGLGAGSSAMRVAKHLANQIRSDQDCPDLVLHALSAGGFQPDRPQRSPVMYFNYFDDVLPRVDCIALFSPTTVSHADYPRIKQSPGVKTAFDRADEIDVVVTSFAWVGDEHGMLGQYLKHLADARQLDPQAIKTMRDAGWIGDVQFQPYAASGPIDASAPERAVSLFGLADLVRIAGTEGKHVVLVARPCPHCGKLKTPALTPLLTEPSLRLWTHLIMDVDTAADVLRARPQQPSRTPASDEAPADPQPQT